MLLTHHMSTRNTEYFSIMNHVAYWQYNLHLQASLRHITTTWITISCFSMLANSVVTRNSSICPGVYFISAFVLTIWVTFFCQCYRIIGVRYQELVTWIWRKISRMTFIFHWQPSMGRQHPSKSFWWLVGVTTTSIFTCFILYFYIWFSQVISNSLTLFKLKNICIKFFNKPCSS